MKVFHPRKPLSRSFSSTDFCRLCYVSSLCLSFLRLDYHPRSPLALESSSSDSSIPDSGYLNVPAPCFSLFVAADTRVHSVS